MEKIYNSTTSEIEFWRISKLPLDDVYVALKDQIPELRRPNLHRCLKRNGLNVLPKAEGEIREKRNSKIIRLKSNLLLSYKMMFFVVKLTL